MKRHQWHYARAASETSVGKRVQGFKGCIRGCGWLRFSGPGKPPWHRYVLATQVRHEDDGSIHKDTAEALAPPCVKVTP